jgi:hypothetical protein
MIPIGFGTTMHLLYRFERVPVIGLKDLPYEELEPFFGQTAHVQARFTSETDSKLLL